jgi:alkylhydroperoxidase family enzyme
MKRGVPPEKVEALREWRDSNLFNDREKATLEYAEAMTISGHRVSNALFERLKEHFNEDALIELAGLAVESQ